MSEYDLWLAIDLAVCLGERPPKPASGQPRRVRDWLREMAARSEREYPVPTELHPTGERR